MARYEITMANGYGREIDTMVVQAPSMAVALTLSGNLLLTGAVRDGEQAVSATVELLGVYECELHSVRAELHNVGPDKAILHEDAGLLDLEAPEPVERPDVARAERLAAELRGEVEGWRPGEHLDETLTGLGDFDGGGE